MDLGLGSMGGGAKPKGNFDVFDSLENSTQSDLIGGMSGMDLTGNRQSMNMSINNSNVTFGGQSTAHFGT